MKKGPEYGAAKVPDLPPPDNRIAHRIPNACDNRNSRSFIELIDPICSRWDILLMGCVGARKAGAHVRGLSLHGE